MDKTNSGNLAIESQARIAALEQALAAERSKRCKLNAYFDQVIEGMLDSVILIGRDLKIIQANSSAEVLLGYEKGSLSGVSVSGIFDLYKIFGEPAGSTESFRARAVKVETSFKGKQGERIAVLLSGSLLFDSSKQIEGFLCVVSDLRERKMMETQLLQSEKLESVGRLAAGIAHEINTPIQFIGDNLRFLEDSFNEMSPLLKLDLNKNSNSNPHPNIDSDYLRDEIPKAIAQSLQGVEKVAKIVRAMKEFSHPGSDSKQSVDLNKLLESAITVSTNEWKYVAEIVKEFDSDLPLVACLPGEINQVSLNLIVNAAHAIADAINAKKIASGKIKISTRHDSNFVEIRISDNGMGIPLHIRDKIFEPFFTTKPVGKGTGQGLTIARSVIVDKHGGTLNFESEISKGTTFIIKLPINVRGT